MEVYKWNNEDRLVQCCPEEAWFFFALAEAKRTTIFT